MCAKKSSDIENLSLVLDASLKLDENETPKKAATRSQPRRIRSGRMRQSSDLSSMMSEPPSPGTPKTPTRDELFRAGRSPRSRLRVRQESDLSGFFEELPPPLASTSSSDEAESFVSSIRSDESLSFPMLKVSGRNMKGPIFSKSG